MIDLKKALIFLELLILSLSLMACGKASPKKDITLSTPKLYYFYDNPCGSCDYITPFIDEYNKIMVNVKTDNPFEIIDCNVFKSSGKAKLDKVFKEYSLSTENLTFPCILVGGVLVTGEDNIKNRMLEQCMAATELYEQGIDPVAENALKKSQLFNRFKVNSKAPTIVYFYRSVCPECIDTADAIKSIPSSVNLIKINTRATRGADRITEFFDKWKVPDDDQSVPILFYKDGYACGKEKIEKFIQGIPSNKNLTGFKMP